MRTRVFRCAAVVIALTLIAGCHTPDYSDVDARQEMRDFVTLIADTARATNAEFIVVPQNGQDLLTANGEPDGTLAADYATTISAQGREDLFYGYDRDDQATDPDDTAWVAGFLDQAVTAGVVALVTDYCSTPENMDDSYAKNEARGFVSFAADSRELDSIPDYPATPHNASTEAVTDIHDVASFLYVLNPDQFSSRVAYLSALDATNYDLFIIDAFYGEAILTSAEVAQLQTKPGGLRRLVISYMSIGEAEDYRYYWESAWDRRADRPEWIVSENPNWPGNYVVAYWEPAWQQIIVGEDGYLSRILDAGFDGVYLDIIDAFEHFE